MKYITNSYSNLYKYFININSMALVRYYKIQVEYFGVSISKKPDLGLMVSTIK